VCWSAFRIFDKDGDGRITQEELNAALHDDDVQGVAGGAKAVAELMKEIDGNGDGAIDFQEFMTMMRGVNDQAQ